MKNSEAFRDACGFMKNALDAGESAENSLFAAYKGLEGLYGEKAGITQGFKNMYSKLRFGYSMEEVLEEFSEYMKNEDISCFVSVFPLLKRAGGNLGKVLNSTLISLRSKLLLRKDLNVAIAAKMGEFRIMSAIPFGILLYIHFCVPDFAAILYHNMFGMIFMSVLLVLEIMCYAMGTYIIRKVLVA